MATVKDAGIQKNMLQNAQDWQKMVYAAKGLNSWKDIAEGPAIFVLFKVDLTPLQVSTFSCLQIVTAVCNFLM